MHYSELRLVMRQRLAFWSLHSRYPASGHGDWCKHMAILGTTGSGKNWLVRSLISQHITSGRGLCLIDLHGDLTLILRRLLSNESEDHSTEIKPAVGCGQWTLRSVPGVGQSLPIA